MMEIFEYPHTITDDEIDVNGHANNVVYIGWLQDAAIAHSAANGWDSARYLNLGMGWVAKSHTIEYIRPAYAGDKIVVQTMIVSKRRVAYTRSYRIVRVSDQEVLAKGQTVWAFIDYATGKPAKIPPEIDNAFPDASKMGRVA